MTRTLSCLFLVVIVTGLSQMNLIEGSEPFKGIDVLPTPKKMEPTGKRFLLNEFDSPSAMIIMDKNDQKAAIAAQEINDRIQALGGQPLPLVADVDEAGSQAPIINVIRLAVPRERRSAFFPAELREIMNLLSPQGEQGYAIRFYQEKYRGRTAFLSGSGWQGLLNAGSTFRLLIKKEGAMIFAIEAQITDWPDFKYRGLPVWPLPGSFDDFKRYIDWAFRYKFNRMYTYTTGKRAADGFNLPTHEESLYLRKVNTYAKERGIKINYALTWALAPVTSDENKDGYSGAAEFNNHYYSWSDDGLLKKRASEIAQFAQETEAGSLLFHCIDTYEEGWDKSGKSDRARFGNDRASADANVINIFSGEISRVNPGIELQFVVYPYHVNFDLPGNENYKMWMKRLTDSISKDVYLTVTEFDKDLTDSWIAIARQPLAHWINGNAFQWGRYFSTFPAFTKTSFYKGRDRDIIIHWEPIGHFNGEVMQLIAAEYAWNVNAPGSGRIIEEKTGKINISGGNLHYRKETVNGTDVNAWAWFDGTREPKPTSRDLLLKACRLEFGETAAPFIADFFKNNPIGWRSPELFSHLLLDAMAGKELEACYDQLNKTNNALLSLRKALQADIDSRVRARLNIFLKNTYYQSLEIAGATAYYRAKKLSTKGLNSEALQEMKHGRNQLSEIRRKMEKQGIWSPEASEWFEAGSNKLKIAEAGLYKGRSVNLISNPDFEEPRDSSARSNEPIPYWSSAGSLKLTTDSHSGKYAANLTLKSSDNFVYLEQPFTVTADCDGFVEFWLKKDGDFRIIPILEYWNEDYAKRMDDLAVDDFLFNKLIQDYTNYNGRFRLPPHVTKAVFKIYADWQGFTPNLDKNLYLDDVFVGCVARQ
jgi:hypothetical protein